MTERLTKKEKGFADDLLETGNGTQAALNNYNTTDTNTAAVIASENIRKPKIREYLESKSSDAASQIYILSQSAENEAVRLNASKDILDRAGFKPVEKTQSVALELKGNIDDPRLDALREKYEEELRGNLLQ